MTDVRYSFIVDYYDPQASMNRKYQLLFFGQDNSVEMFDLKNKRVFLKRSPYPSLSVKELFVGASVTVHSRSLKIVDYGDVATRNAFLQKNESACLIVHGKSVYSVGKIIDTITSQDVRILDFRLCEFPPSTAAELGVSPRCYVISLRGADASSKLEAVAKTHREIAIFAQDEDIKLIESISFGSTPSTATLDNCAVCVIKPHAIAAGHGGQILQRIVDEGFEITALGMFSMSIADAEDFLEVYKGVVPEYKKLVEHMAGAPSWALELRAENSVAALRAVCGPHDPEVCRVLFPTTIRAMFGTDRVKNSVHCTDLPEDGPLESEFFFSLLLNK